MIVCVMLRLVTKTLSLMFLRRPTPQNIGWSGYTRSVLHAFNSVAPIEIMNWITFECLDMVNFSNLSNSESNRSRIWTTEAFPGHKISHGALRALKAFPYLLLMGVNYFVFSCFNKKKIVFLFCLFHWGSHLESEVVTKWQIQFYQVFLKHCKGFLKVKLWNKEVLGNVGGIVCVKFTIWKHESQLRWTIQIIAERSQLTPQVKGTGFQGNYLICIVNPRSRSEDAVFFYAFKLVSYHRLSLT